MSSAVNKMSYGKFPYSLKVLCMHPSWAVLLSFKFGQLNVASKDFYQHENTTIPLLVKMPKNVFSYGVSRYDKMLPI